MSKSQEDLDREAATKYTDVERELYHSPYEVHLGYLAGLQHERAKLQAEIERLQTSLEGAAATVKYEQSRARAWQERAEVAEAAADQSRELVKCLEYAEGQLLHAGYTKNAAQVVSKVLAKFKGDRE